MSDTPDPVLAAFRAALSSPRYAELLAEAEVDPALVGSFEAFLRLVPILRKEQLFAPEIPFHRLCRGGELGAIRSAMISSGFTGNNSLAIARADELGEAVEGIDAGLDLLFGTDGTPTLLINAFPMGIHLPTRHPLAETGPRSDLAVKILERFGPYFEQTVVLADPHLIKKIVDEGNERGLDWEARQTSFVAGEDWLPETLRTYIHTQTGVTEGGRRTLLGTMGLTELGLNIFFETRETVRLRRQALRDPGLRNRLFPEAGAAVPSLFHYDPRRFLIEGLAHPQGRELAFTALSPSRAVPMIRYASGDLGAPLPPGVLAEALGPAGLMDLHPTLPLPCAWVAGRPRAIETSRGVLRAEELRQGIYSDPEVARAVTGHFTVHPKPLGERAAVQLRRGVRASESLRRAAEEALFSIAGWALPTELYGYDDYPFGKDVNYDVKFSHWA
jgi:phenylacetate-CoA ligase